MKIRKITLKNWMNYKNFSAEIRHDRVFVIGANASGKSNLLDAFRFLRDVALPAGIRPSGGGLQKAVNDRGGLKHLRCLNARQDPEILLGIELEASASERWHYILGFKGEGQGSNRVIISQEIVNKITNGKSEGILKRPDTIDARDHDRLTQTHLELTNSNEKFRDIAHYFSETTYLHLVPQLLKFANLIGGNTIERDPFGQGFLQRVAATSAKVRDSRLHRIQKVLSTVVPQFAEFKFQKDPITGLPHIEARFNHWRPKAGWQRENQLSDGTLRLIGLLWSLMEGNSLLLLEEPELSLNEEIVRSLPKLISGIQRLSKNTGRQVIITTHSEAMLSDASIPQEGILRIRPGKNGTETMPVTEEENIMLQSGIPVGEVLLKPTAPKEASQMLLALK
jgi:predicted ATPase